MVSVYVLLMHTGIVLTLNEGITILGEDQFRLDRVSDDGHLRVLDAPEQCVH